jgi:hypothetical protein
VAPLPNLQKDKYAEDKDDDGGDGDPAFVQEMASRLFLPGVQSCESR